MRRFVIVTSTLNGARFIRETLASIDRQTYSEWVHLVVDAGSSDGTLEIVRESIQHQPRRQLLIAPKTGLYEAIFLGFATLEGAPEDICFWLNADDLLAPWALATAAEAFSETGVEWITGLPAQWDVQGRLRGVLPLGWHPRRLIRMGLFTPDGLGTIQQESTFFSRRLLELLPHEAQQRICMTKLAGDFLLWRAFAETHSLVTVPTVLSGFRKHDANASVLGRGRYMEEIKASGIFVPPPFIGRILRMIYRATAPLVILLKARRRLI